MRKQLKIVEILIEDDWDENTNGVGEKQEVKLVFRHFCKDHRDFPCETTEIEDPFNHKCCAELMDMIMSLKTAVMLKRRLQGILGKPIETERDLADAAALAFVQMAVKPEEA